MKQLIAQLEKFRLKKDGTVVRRMTICRRAIFPPTQQRVTH